MKTTITIDLRYAALLLVVLLLSGCSAAVSIGQPAAVSPAAASAPASAEQSGDVEGADCERTPGACAAETILVSAVDYLTLLAELSGAFVIAVGVIRALWKFMPHIFQREHDAGEYKEDIRLQLGKSLALALEFELGADILKTAVAPTLPIIGQLAAIIVLRTALNYFLERELREVEQRRADLHLRPGRAEGETSRV
jgi:uncharacterized membrane protein/uncharacterized protein YceK